MDGYVDIDLVCTACNYTCLTCNGTSSSDCLTCNSSNFRSFSSNKCDCDPRYYDDGTDNPKCQPCNYSCYACSGNLETQCTDCYANDHRHLNNSNQCICDYYYYDDGTENSICQPCNHTCLTCNGPGVNQCLSCNSSDHRTYDSTTCPCDDGYIDNSVLICVSCHSTCFNCDLPNSETNCTACQSSLHRTLNVSTHKCVCDERYFQNSSQLCQSCHPSCLTCTGESDNECDSCKSDDFRKTIDATTHK
eukprot:TRINITY_DN7064_c0_g1_i1.p2 TRINITY_DN7064_c0_g1~~TRINITY_DN7064_c0_g1_i1.p2  ORF type:complete len:248 (+),score=42.83 TRINITY_DN7064_c0_g1_i1:768-1511(+)